MCNLYNCTTTFEAARRLFGLSSSPVNIPPRPAIWPRDRAPIVRLGRDGGRELLMAGWGLVPFWAKDDKIASQTFNARSETVDAKPAFREAFKRRRCLVPANAYYEWEGPKGAKRVVQFTVRDQPLFAMAGLWERNEKVGEGPLETFTIVTTDPNSVAAAVHNRMPVVLAPDDWAVWLDPETPPQEARALLTACPDDWLAVEHTGRTAREMRAAG